MTATTRWVVEHEGRWAVTKEDRERVSDLLDTQEEAIKRGHVIVRNLGGGELIVHNHEGQIRDKITVAPGHDDPNSPG